MIIEALADIQPEQIVVVDIGRNVAWPTGDGTPTLTGTQILAKAAAGIRIPKGEIGSVEPLPGPPPVTHELPAAIELLPTNGDTPTLTMRVPRCAKCRTPGTVKVHQQAAGQQVTLTWCCMACDHEWPITARVTTR